MPIQSSVDSSLSVRNVVPDLRVAVYTLQPGLKQSVGFYPISTHKHCGCS